MLAWSATSRPEARGNLELGHISVATSKSLVAVFDFASGLARNGCAWLICSVPPRKPSGWGASQHGLSHWAIAVKAPVIAAMIVHPSSLLCQDSNKGLEIAIA